MKPDATPRWWATYGAAALTALTGAGYLIGAASIAAFAETLGVTVQDLGVGTQDRLVLAAVYGIAMVSYVAVSVGLVLVVFGILWPRVDRRIRKEEAAKGENDRLSILTLLLALGVLLLAAVTVVLPIVTFGYYQRGLGFPVDGPTIGVLLVFVVMLLGLSVYVVTAPGEDDGSRSGWWRLGRLLEIPPVVAARSAGVAIALLVLFVPVAASYLSVRSGDGWARAILSSSAANEPIPDERPWTLHLLLQPAAGHADGECVVRVNDRVVVREGVAIVTAIDTFESDGCA